MWILSTSTHSQLSSAFSQGYALPQGVKSSPHVACLSVFSLDPARKHTLFFLTKVAVCSFTTTTVMLHVLPTILTILVLSFLKGLLFLIFSSLNLGFL